MFDLNTFSDGFGVVFAPFVVGVVIRAILSTLGVIGQRSKYNNMMMVFIIFCLAVPGSSFAGSFTNSIDSIRQDGSILFLSQDVTEYYTGEIFTKEIIIDSFFDREEITVTFNDVTKEVETVGISESSGLYAKNVSLALGGLSCMAFCIGIGLKI